jgi:hypothetical protein
MKGRGDRANQIVLVGSTLAAGVGGMYLNRVVLAAIPMIVAGWGIWAANPHARHLKRVGWTLVVGVCDVERLC